MANEVGAMNILGNHFKLSQSIKAGFVSGTLESLKAVYSTRESMNAIATQSLDTANLLGTEPLLAGKTDEKTETVYGLLVLHMPEGTGNEANHNGTAPTIDLGIRFIAKQATVEEDSFDESYDKKATYDWSNSATTDWYVEDTAEPGVYTISTAEELAGFAKLVNSGETFKGETVKLDADIDLMNAKWTPIGYDFYNAAFSGTFDGQDHTISNLSVSETDGKYAGLFGEMVGGVVQNLNVVNANINGTFCAGVIVGHTYGKVLNCNVTNATVNCVPGYDADKNVYKDGNNAGVIAGFIESNGDAVADIAGNVVTKSNVSAFRCVGGLVGTATSGAILSDNTLEDVSVSYITLPAGAVEEEGKTNSDIGTVAGRLLVGATEVNNEIIIPGKVTSTKQFNEAAADGETEFELVAGTYIVPDIMNKTLTITGDPDGETIVATQDDGSYEGCDYSLDGSTVTFENITINTDSTTYTGYARMNGTYNNCTINGTYTLYGNSVFNDCTFEVSGDVYNIWTWGAPNAT
ncbi:MAG: hypothetical protein IJ391_05450, partial [Clostridia bacterium]|nr:hypothetical protein [Clostridia bacterium]